MIRRLIFITFFLFILTTNLLSSPKYFLIKANYNRTFWFPSGIDQVDYNTTGLNAFRLSLDLSPFRDKIIRQSGFPILCCFPEFRYLWTPDNKAEQKELISLYKVSNNPEAIEKFWLDIPIFYFLFSEKTSIFHFRYEKSAFLAKLKLNESKNYIPFDGSPLLLEKHSIITKLTEFELFTTYLELQMTNSTELGFAYFIQKYRKPYSITIEGINISKDILDCKLSSHGPGIYLKYKTRFKKKFNINYDLMIGFGFADLEFSGEEDIETYIDDTKTPALFLIDTSCDFLINITKCLKMNISAQLNYYDFHLAYKTENRIQSNKEIDDLDLNIDNIIKIYSGFVFSF